MFSRKLNPSRLPWKVEKMQLRDGSAKKKKQWSLNKNVWPFGRSSEALTLTPYDPFPSMDMIFCYVLWFATILYILTLLFGHVLMITILLRMMTVAWLSQGILTFFGSLWTTYAYYYCSQHTLHLQPFICTFKHPIFSRNATEILQKFKKTLPKR